jgi:hypothetical protein
MTSDFATRGAHERLRRRPITALALAAAAVSAAWLCVSLFPAQLPAPQDPTYVDNIFASREIVWIVRLLLASAAGVLVIAGTFVVASTVVHMRRGNWLRRAGSFEIAESARRRTASSDGESDGSTDDGDDELTDLRVRLAISSELLEKFIQERGR